MTMVVVGSNVLHHVKRKGEYPGVGMSGKNNVREGKCPDPEAMPVANGFVACADGTDCKVFCVFWEG